ncbi:MAG: citrate synthase [Phycisphaerae bacterium]|jgi:2-methylcitrate synthase/citrate synthase II|nr:citrate synthase [Phycisphaerae bacterium]HRS28281.1 citrate/2-methylcitrate synthase [Phycisphaerae bacterium]
MTSTTAEIYSPGLEGVIAGETAICCVDQDRLLYRGYDISDLAEHASFEECAFLLLHGELPTAKQLELFREQIEGERELPGAVVDVLRAIPRQAPMMDVLRTGVSLCGNFSSAKSQGRSSLITRAVRVLAEVPSLIAARLRVMEGKWPVEPRPGLSHAAQFFWQAFQREPTPLEEKVLNLTLVLYAEHEFNASTFAARVCTSTLSGLHSSVVAAIGTLKGPLHGGANEAALQMMLPFSSAAQARKWTEDALAGSAKIMGFGHRVYKNGDHRAHILEPYVDQLAEARNEPWRAEVYHAIKQVMWEKKRLHPNVDYPCGLVYYFLGLPPDIYTPLFVMARVSGWCAHIIEQHEHNRLIRPRSKYTGPPRRPWQPLAAR